MNHKIRESLKRSTANPERGLAYLRVMKELKVTPLMLKKNTECVEGIRLLRQYVGNTKDWDLSEEDMLHFNDIAENIRQIAVEIFDHFQVILNQS